MCIIVYFVLAMLLGGCCHTNGVNDGSATYYIFGFGKISVKKTCVATIVDNTSVGFYLADDPSLKMNLGYSSEYTIWLDPKSNQLVEVKKKASGDIDVKTTKGDNR